MIFSIPLNVYTNSNEISQWKFEYLQSNKNGKVAITGIELYLGVH